MFPKSIILTCLLLSVLLPRAQKEITLEDIWKTYAFYPKSVSGMQALNNGKHYAVISENNLVVYDYRSGDSITSLIRSVDLIPPGSDTPLSLNEYSLSPDETLALIPTETESIYRHSKKSTYYLYNIKSKELRLLSEGGKQQLATFSPDGKKIAYVRENNLFVQSLSSRLETQLTNDGLFNHIINGTTDWVYEEEFGFTKAFYWSPDSKRIAYYKFDESRVKEYSFPVYGNLYPEIYTYKYPKTGEDNSEVEIHIFELASLKDIVADQRAGSEQYIPRIKWTTDPEVLSIQKMNRLQNHLKLYFTDAKTGKSKLVYEEKSPYYIEVTDNLFFLKESNQWLITSEKDGYNHIYLHSVDGSPDIQLTSGNWDVTEIYGYDQKEALLYYQSAESSPLNRDIYRVNLTGERVKLSEMDGWNDASFSKDYGYFFNAWSDANTPPVYSIHNKKGKSVRIIEDNDELVEKMKAYGFSPKTFFTISDESITLPGQKVVSLNAWQILPQDFDSTRAYPLLMYVYGGPGSQTVTNSWGWFNYVWFQLLAQHGIAVVSVDNRGTGARGELFKKMTYKELGNYEIADQITAAKILGSKPFIDQERTAMFGWSYGGYMSTLAITKGAEVFETAIAVAPVANWRNYDNIYTERFMQKPAENASGYDDNSPINHVDKMEGSFLLVHGSADDNVHFQNTMELITALVEADKQFDLMVYPDKNHGIYGGNTRYHLYKKMTDFLFEHLQKE